MKKYILSILFLLVGVYASAQCVDPTALNATAITETTALLGWTENSTPPATTWEIEIVDTGVAPTGTATATATVIPYLATSLASGETFDFYVRSDCGGTFSGWSGPFSFTTLPCNFSTISITSTNQCLEYCFFPNGPQFGAFFDFNTGVLPTGWSASPFAVGQPCTTNMIDNTDYFWAQATNGAGVRLVNTNVVDVSLGGTVRFYMRYGSDDPSVGCEDPDIIDEGVFLQYSIDGGATWVTINSWEPTGILTDALYQWTEYTEAIPAAAQTSTTVFRWFQPVNSGTDFDNWGLDNVQISANTSGNFVWDFGDGNTSTAQNPCHTFTTPGDYTISLSVAAANCIASSSDILTVADTVDPIAVCQDYIVTLDASGSATITAADIDNGSSDNCAIDTMTISQTVFTSADGGSNPVTLTVTDTSGNVSTCVANVIVPYSCGSVFTDTGGSTGQYQNSENEAWVFSPNNPGEFVQLDFTMVNVETCCDNIAVYNGPDATFPVLNADLENPAIFTSTDPSGMLFVTFTSDSSVVRDGWEATISCVTCPGPTNLLVSNVTVSTAEISWTDAGATQWEIEIVPVGTAPTGTGVVTTSNPYVASGLNAATQYEVYIRSLCSPTDTSAWISGTFFTTLYECGSVFTDTGGITGDYQNNEDLTWAFSPGALGVQVELNFTFVDIESGWDQLDIYDGPDMTAPLLAANVLAPGTFTSTHPSGMLFVHFDSDSSVQRGGWEATIVCNNPCATPTTIATSNATGFTMDVSWVEAGTATEWEVEAVPTGFPPTGAGTVTTANPYTVTGLLPDTTYDFYVTAVCSTGVSESFPGGPVTDTTICDASIFTGISLDATLAINSNEILLCNGATVDLSLSGGFIPNLETYQWQLDGVDVPLETNNSYTGVAVAGLYTAVVTIGNCVETFDVNVVISEAYINIIVHDDCTTTSTVEDGLGNPITGGTFSFNPIPTDGAMIDPVTGELQIISAGTSYTVEYTTLAGCVSSYTLLTASDYGCIIPSGISPNGDGLNDSFDISFLQADKLSVFNRHGKKVYVKNDYTNEWFGNSDGGSELPVGTYYYVIEVPDTSTPITGWVYINREK